jgi:general secretion pathway protein N
MVERQMIARRTSIAAAAAACAVAAIAGNLVLAADNPAGFDPRGDEFSRPVTIMPRAAPMAPLPALPDSMSTDGPERGNPLWGISIESLHATRERPIFSPSRRPPPPAVIAAPAEPAKVVAPPTADEPTLNLLGIVAGTREGYAIFLNNTTHDIVRLKTGEGEDGWILRSVSGREAVLEKNHRTKVVRLPSLTGERK